MMKTYRRPIRHILDENSEPAQKKRRVDSGKEKDAGESEQNLESAIRESSAAILSSPSRRNSIVLSSDGSDDDLSTPPSSPPALQLTPPPANTRKPTFSFLKRKRGAMSGQSTNGSTPLIEVNSNNLRPSADPPRKKQQQQAQRQPVLKQTQIDLGGDVRKTCPGCGMEYVPSNAEDVALHKKYHDNHASGVDLGKAFVKANASRWVYEATRFDEGYVVIIDRKSSPSAKNQAKRVLEVVNKELSSAEIDDATLWSQTSPPKRLQKNGVNEETDRFKVFLHMKDSKCVGLCLTERIWEAHPVERKDMKANGDKSPQNAANSSSITAADEVHPAVVGISRVWTSASSRRKGIAMDLLDCVVSNYFYGVEIPKSQIAFSQPTESGCRLIESFYGSDEPWHVYKET